MSPIRPSVILVVACALLPTLFTVPARACKCMETAVAEAKQAAQAVFEGRVVSVSPGDLGGHPALVVELKTVRTWKGLKSVEQVTVVTSAESASCGFPFEKDQSYLVYATESEGRLHVSLCSRTKPMAQAADDLAQLGAGVTPVKVDASTVKETTPETAKPRTGGCASAHASVTGETRLAAAFAPLAAVALTVRRRRRS